MNRSYTKIYPTEVRLYIYNRDLNSQTIGCFVFGLLSHILVNQIFYRWHLASPLHIRRKNKKIPDLIHFFRRVVLQGVHESLAFT